MEDNLLWKVEEYAVASVRQRRPPRLMIEEVRLKLPMESVAMGVLGMGKKGERQRDVTSRPRMVGRVWRATVRLGLAGREQIFRLLPVWCQEG
jgi:hypothetical protein